MTTRPADLARDSGGLAGVATTGAGASGGADGGKAPKKKGRRRQIVIALVVVLLLGGYIAKGKLLKPHYGPGHQAPNGQILTLGSLTVNLSDGHLIETNLALQLTTVASTKQINTDLPKFDNAAITVLGEQTYPGLLAPAGRAALKVQLVKAFQQVAGKADGSQQVTAVYFTSFILQ
jgi:flagellar basal body-associated protein FliL